MATELGKAYVQIIPSAKGIAGSIKSVLSGESVSAGQSAGLNIAGAIKGAIAGAGIGVALKKTLEAGGDLQQSLGGLETLYGDAAKSMKEMSEAAVQAGIDSNTYAEQAVSFGASLKQAYGGDVVAAAKAADTAILDMADNSAKMGTDIASIVVVLIIWSVGLFFLSAAHIPNAIPIGILKIIDIRLTVIVAGRRRPNTSATSLP
jgi:hypothetical protein